MAGKRISRAKATTAAVGGTHPVDQFHLAVGRWMPKATGEQQRRRKLKRILTRPILGASNGEAA